MRPLLAASLFALVAGGSRAATGQAAPVAEFRRWAAREAHRVGTGAWERDPGLAALADMAGSAHVVAFGEPLHLGHESLVQRNRLIKYLVTNRGVTAIALETALSPSKRVYDHILGVTTAPDSVLVESFTYGFGKLAANRELIAWLRTVNARRPPDRKVRLYGIDLTGQMTGSARPAVELVVEYLTRVDRHLGDSVRADFADVLNDFQSGRFPALPSAAKDRIAGRIADLLALVRRNRIQYAAASSIDDYEWALRQGVALEQEQAFLRLLPPDAMAELAKGLDSLKGTGRLQAMFSMREVAMADNLAWVAERERGRGRVFFFAHDTHLQAAPINLRRSDPMFGLFDGRPTAGNYIRAMLGRDYFIAATYYGTAEGTPPEAGFTTLPADPGGIDGLLAAPRIPAYVFDLRRLPSTGPLGAWFRAPHPTRGGNFGETVSLLTPTHAFDAILYLDRIAFLPP